MIIKIMIKIIVRITIIILKPTKRAGEESSGAISGTGGNGSGLGACGCQVNTELQPREYLIALKVFN